MERIAPSNLVESSLLGAQQNDPAYLRPVSMRVTKPSNHSPVVEYTTSILGTIFVSDRASYQATWPVGLMSLMF